VESKFQLQLVSVGAAWYWQWSAGMMGVMSFLYDSVEG